uniref:Uncharacterized protein n=1 Tax=Arundo donax TaxID=35708 RepID=A0A0A9G6N8_ARUDO
MLPAVEPILSNSNCDFESSSKKEMAACLSSVVLLDNSFIVLAMALVFPMISFPSSSSTNKHRSSSASH